jgi:hypothetical protein
MPLVFQYGSNTDAARLQQRLGEVEDLGRVRTVKECDIAFNVWSQSNGCAASNLMIVPGTGQHAWGVLYGLTYEQFAKLKVVEGKRYEPKTIRVRKATDEEVDATT